MKHFCDDWVRDWCERNGWSDLFIERCSYWAFPPNSVMPIPVPTDALLAIKRERGLSPQEKLWLWLACLGTLVSAASSVWLTSPMPLVFAFAFCAVVAGQLEVEDV